MTLEEFIQALEGLATEAESAFASIKNKEEFEETRVAFVGARNGN